MLAAAGAMFVRGIDAYRRHPYRRAPEKAQVVWRRGSAALFDHGVEDDGAIDDKGAVPVLFVPSLINRGMILDLKPGRGMLSWLARHGVRPYRLEWGPPGVEESGFAVADYVEARLEPALDAVGRLGGRPPVLAGYCMGGLLALAAALRRPQDVSALALLAVPWDFHGNGAERPRSLAAAYELARPALARLGHMPIDAIQAFFLMHDPIVALRKFRRFAGLDPNSPEAEDFVALEDWLNDGVALPLAVADEAVRDWYGMNATGRGAWRLGGMPVDPAALAMPVLVVVPENDRIVPPASAAAIFSKPRLSHRIDPAGGHIGMVAGRRAEAALWKPLADWIRMAGNAA